MNHVPCGIDIGGTKLAAWLMDVTGRLLSNTETPEYSCMDEAYVLDLISDKVKALCAESGVNLSDLVGVGVGMAGHIRQRDGIVITTSMPQEEQRAE